MLSTRIRGLITYLSLFVLAVALVGCTALRGVAKQRLSLPLDADIKTFNPVLVSDAYSAAALGVVFSGLLTTDKNGNLIPELAEKWEFRNDGLELLFTLKSGLKWSDGKPLTIEDVLFTFRDIYFNEAIPSSIQDIFRVGEKRELPQVEKVNDRVISFKLPEPFAPFLRFAGGASILPKHILAKAVREKDTTGKPKFLQTWAIDTDLHTLVGNGPYVLKRYLPAERLVYERNPHYYRQSLPHIPRLVYQIMPSPDSTVLRFRSRDIDVIPQVRAQDFPILKRQEDRYGFRIYQLGEGSSRSFLMFNLNRGRNQEGKPFVDPVKAEWFNDVNFRRAIAYGINRQAMINTYYRGLGLPQDSPIPPLSPYHFSRQEGVPFYDYDPDKAKELLQRSGFSYNSQNRLVDKNGNLVRFTIMTSTGGAGATLAPMIKNDLDRLGITVDLQIIDFTALIDRLDRSKNWETAMLGWGGGIEPHGSFHLWYSAGSSHMFNLGPNPGEPPFPGRVVSDWEREIDRLLIAGAREIDEKKRRQIYGQFQKLVQEQVPMIFMVSPRAMSAVSNRLRGIDPSPAGGVLWNLDELRLAD
ncbi:MAG: ABC transporter substrate-binding protein [Pseudanabaenaceae cyanobacterium SKYGB_i_bin29]|nr:ABC transporter substrate-binding protein [Pseudanabaenaceae cyanobacterium SKYG29]MDW8421902.1 ABC transporter substrate-binding protein [Pseudanabaenaceae cyanobacterium SKYGB_i_bin29]